MHGATIGVGGFLDLVLLTQNTVPVEGGLCTSPTNHR